MRRRLWSMALALAWACGTAAAAAEAADSPARVADSMVADGPSAGQFFFVESVDGKKVDGNNLDATARASHMRGAQMQVLPFERSVPTGAVKLGLQTRGHHVVPIVGLLGKSRPSGSGTVDVTLQPGMRYRVTGFVDAYRRELWLEEADSKRMVGAKIVLPFEAEADPKAMAGAAFTCCNLHYDGDWISDANWSTAPMIPAGARIKVLSVGSNRAEVLIEGRKMRAGLDYGRKQMGMQQFLALLLVPDDPTLRVALLPADMQAAVRAGKVMAGMPRDAVIVALGHPRADETPSIQSDAWRYHTVTEEPFTVRFGADGRVAAIDALPGVAALVVHAP